MTAREDLIKKIIMQGNPNDINEPSPIVSIHDFFYGNNDIGSIGCNIDDHPGIDNFFSVLKKIENDERVQAVYVEIHELSEDEDDWPFSERVYLIAKASQEIIEYWVSSLEPDEISEGWSSTPPKGAPNIKPGYKVFNIWWD